MSPTVGCRCQPLCLFFSSSKHFDFFLLSYKIVFSQYSSTFSFSTVFSFFLSFLLLFPPPRFRITHPITNLFYLSPLQPSQPPIPHPHTYLIHLHTYLSHPHTFLFHSHTYLSHPHIYLSHPLTYLCYPLTYLPHSLVLPLHLTTLSLLSHL
uniref:Uncharacterized protein n=1 Tax=Cacopsylla melanoneura TaxID=428564 RepID=A0A8D9AV04_9HEMI